jgi:hypothetical protein
MNADGLVLDCRVSFKRGRNGRKHLRVGRSAAPDAPRGRVPRVARLMALAIKLDGQIRAGDLSDWADVARLGHVTRGRASQIAALMNLAPDIIEAVLYMPIVERGRDPITERDLRPITAVVSWAKQRRMWKALSHERQQLPTTD